MRLFDFWVISNPYSNFSTFGSPLVSTLSLLYLKNFLLNLNYCSANNNCSKTQELLSPFNNLFQDIADEMYDRLKTKKIASLTEKDFSASLSKLKQVSPTWVKFSELAIQVGLNKDIVSISIDSSIDG